MTGRGLCCAQTLATHQGGGMSSAQGWELSHTCPSRPAQKLLRPKVRGLHSGNIRTETRESATLSLCPARVCVPAGTSSKTGESSLPPQERVRLPVRHCPPFCPWYQHPGFLGCACLFYWNPKHFNVSVHNRPFPSQSFLANPLKCPDASTKCLYSPAPKPHTQHGGEAGLACAAQRLS